MKISDTQINPSTINRIVHSAFRAAGVMNPEEWNKIHPKANNLKRMKRVIIRAIKKGIKAERERSVLKYKEASSR